MSNKVQSIGRQVVNVLGGVWCWRVVMALAVVQALWLVASAQYPMAFDENYHFGLIQLHAQQWLPFFTSQPDTGVYGAIVRDPSYLFHWLLSFPHRLVALFTHNQTAQIIVLRLINVAMFAYGLVLYRRIITKIGVSAALANSLFLVFILIPVVPFLAAHINYDNLLMVAVPLAVLLCMRLLEGIAQKRLDATALLQLLIVLLLGSLIKYPFLPVAAVVVLFLGWRLWREDLLNGKGWRSFVASFWRISRWVRVVLVTACVIAFGLFAERYAVNVARYHTPVPACDKVISLNLCVQYGPFGRDHRYEAGKSPSFQPNPVYYIGQWFRGMWYRLFFAINYNYTNYPPLLIISWTAVLMAALLALGIIVRLKQLLKNNVALQLLFWLIVGYLVVLFVDGFQMYAATAVPVAINGRYLIPFMPFMFALGGLAWAQLLRGRLAAKAAFAGLIIAIFVLQGGGAMTYIVRSHDDWIWQNDTMRSANRVVRSVAWPFIVGNKNY